MKILSRTGLAAIAALAAASCADSGKWHLNGSIEGLGDSDTVLLEANNQGYWYVLDTIKPDNNGSFRYAGEAHGYPDVFRVRVGSSTAYFPIDSLETVTLTATAPDLTATARIEGSDAARSMMRVDSLVAASASRCGVGALGADSELKRLLADEILADPASIISYYIINKTVGQTPLYDVRVAADHRIIGAVANAYTTRRPLDPRTRYLKSLYLNNRRSAPGAPAPAGASMQATVIDAFEINLFDQEGREHSLLQLTASGRPVLLNFTVYGAEWSPAFNVALNNVYEKYRNQGLEIFQVAFDEDEYAWKQAARNIPWVTVYNSLADGDRLLRQYNVTSLPTLFLFNRKGELVQRITTVDGIGTAVSRVI